MYKKETILVLKMDFLSGQKRKSHNQDINIYKDQKLTENYFQFFALQDNFILSVSDTKK